jgi:5-methylcytosine-specific restriction endonuclease McrA
METVNRKLVKIGNSRAVIIPHTWLSQLEDMTGQNIEEINMETNSYTCKIQAVIEGFVYIRPQWLQQVKQKMIDDTGGECCICHRLLMPSSLILHHTKPINDGGKDSINNLMLVCHKCHRILHDSDCNLGEARKQAEIQRVNKQSETARSTRKREDVTKNILDKAQRQRRIENP